MGSRCGGGESARGSASDCGTGNGGTDQSPHSSSSSHNDDNDDAANTGNSNDA